MNRNETDHYDHPLESKRRWQVSSRCTAGNCVQVALESVLADDRVPGNNDVLIRDSKQLGLPGGAPTIQVSRAEWALFIDGLMQSDLVAAGPLRAEREDGGDVILSGNDVRLTFFDAEWVAFLHGVRAREFSPVLVASGQG